MTTCKRKFNFCQCLLTLGYFVILTTCKCSGVSISITLIESAVERGADGTPPAYFYDPGSGSGASSWLVDLESGAWCVDVARCVIRKGIFLGSSSKMNKTMEFSGILGNSQASNPDFYNWNRVKVKYCDGSSFTGDSVDESNGLYFRGARVWEAIMDELLAKGMKNAENAILSGCSAGGLAAILHCDKFRSLLPGSKVKCVCDGGYFIHGKDLSGDYQIEKFFTKVVKLHGSASNLPSSCTSRMRPELCFFPQYVAQTMETPLFVINAAFDSWQISNILAPNSTDESGSWLGCKLDFKNCSTSQLKVIMKYRSQFLKALKFGGGDRSSRGAFIDSCHVHCQTGVLDTWMSEGSTEVGNTKLATAVGNWFYDRERVKLIDCDDYPCNPTCYES